MFLNNCKLLEIEDLKDPLNSVQRVIEENNNFGNVLISAKVSSECQSKACILGIDEAGRGPVLGPMVYSTCYCVQENVDLLTKAGCADSKTLTEEKREVAYKLLCDERDSIGWIVDIISPNVISNSMLKRQKCSLNEISHNSAIQLIKLALDAGVNVKEVYVDTVGPSEKYQDKLSRLFPDINITVSKKADSLYPIVSAASIFAKVTRDLALKTWVFPENVRFDDEDGWGSGYPNDPVTKAFLSKNVDNVFGFPQIVRFSWSTAQKILNEKAVEVSWSDEEEDAAASSGNKSITTFFKKPDQKSKHFFFSDRCLQTKEFI